MYALSILKYLIMRCLLLIFALIFCSLLQMYVTLPFWTFWTGRGGVKSSWKIQSSLTISRLWVCCIQWHYTAWIYFINVLTFIRMNLSQWNIFLWSAIKTKSGETRESRLVSAPDLKKPIPIKLSSYNFMFHCQFSIILKCHFSGHWFYSFMLQKWVEYCSIQQIRLIGIFPQQGNQFNWNTFSKLLS